MRVQKEEGVRLHGVDDVAGLGQVTGIAGWGEEALRALALLRTDEAHVRHELEVRVIRDPEGRPGGKHCASAGPKHGVAIVPPTTEPPVLV